MADKSRIAGTVLNKHAKVARDDARGPKILVQRGHSLAGEEAWPSPEHEWLPERSIPWL